MSKNKHLSLLICITAYGRTFAFVGGNSQGIPWRYRESESSFCISCFKLTLLNPAIEQRLKTDSILVDIFNLEGTHTSWVL